MSNFDQIQTAFLQAGGHYWGEFFPAIHVAPEKTSNGTPYLTAAGAVVLAKTQTQLGGMAPFLKGFEHFPAPLAYTADDPIDHGAQIVKAAGQLCYLSFGSGRTRNVDAARYLENIRVQRHGSVLEHASISVLIYGIDRAVTHELVRHRAGLAYSQVSQRYVDGAGLRFVLRPEFQGDAYLQRDALAWFDTSRARYDARAARLLQIQEDKAKAAGEVLGNRVARRKSVNQAARACLPNETEAPIIVTGNVRAWRHVLEMRVHEAADETIRRAMGRVFLVLAMTEPLLFDDYEFIPLGKGSDFFIHTPTRKV